MPAPVPNMTVDQLDQALGGGAVLVDVRQPDEYESGHVPGAVLVPLQELPARLGELPAARPLHVICRSGGRSLAAAEFLIEHGIDAVNVAGGTLAWIDSGRGVVHGSAPT